MKLRSLTVIVLLSLLSGLCHALPPEVQNIVNQLGTQKNTNHLIFETYGEIGENYFVALKCENESDQAKNLETDINNQVIAEFRKRIVGAGELKSYELVTEGFKPKLCTTIEGTQMALFMTYIEFEGNENDFGGKVKMLSLNFVEYLPLLKVYQTLNETDFGYAIYSDSVIPEIEIPGHKTGEFKHIAKIQKSSIKNIMGIEGEGEVIRASLTYYNPITNGK